jgi:hypothetical protein
MSLSNHQIFMLKHLAMGWKFKLTNKVMGSWNTYWSLRRRGLVLADSKVTELGRKVLAKELQLQAKRDAQKTLQTTKEDRPAARTLHARTCRGQGAADNLAAHRQQAAGGQASGQHGQALWAGSRAAHQAAHAGGQQG